MFKSDLNSLIDPDFPKAPTPLQPAPNREPIQAVRVKSGEVSSAPSAGGEIADEIFTEQSRQVVTYTVISENDPTVFFVVEAVTQLTLLEQDGRTVVMNFEPPEDA